MVLVDRSLRWELEIIRGISSANDLKTWFVEYPNLERFYTPYSAVVTLEELVMVHSQAAVYRPTDFHWLVLYECLKNYCLWHNDRLSQSGEPFLLIGGYRFGSLDFESIMERYFWDQDFMADLGETGSVGCPLQEETINLSMGLSPHPSKLRFTLVQDVAWHVPEPQECGQWRLP